MDLQPTLPTDRAYDLPPFWDGKPVVWEGWQPLADAFICPPPRKECCPACGSLERPTLNRGRVGTSTEVTHQDIADTDAARKRLPDKIRYKIKTKAYYELAAFRCPDCRHDQVSQLFGDTTWDLEEHDYTADGSWP